MMVNLVEEDIDQVVTSVVNVDVEVHTGQFYDGLDDLHRGTNLRKTRKSCWTPVGVTVARSDTHTTKCSLGSKYNMGVNMGMPMEATVR
jgi:hypothetical protein